MSWARLAGLAGLTKTMHAYLLITLADRIQFIKRQYLTFTLVANRYRFFKVRYIFECQKDKHFKTQTRLIAKNAIPRPPRIEPATLRHCCHRQAIYLHINAPARAWNGSSWNYFYNILRKLQQNCLMNCTKKRDQNMHAHVHYYLKRNNITRKKKHFDKFIYS